MRFGFGLDLSVGDSRRSGAILGISVSNTLIGEDALVGDLVGTLVMMGGTEPATFSLSVNPGGLWAIDGDRLEVAASLDGMGGTVESPTIKVVDDLDREYETVVEIDILEVHFVAGTPAGFLFLLTRA